MSELPALREALRVTTERQHRRRRRRRVIQPLAATAVAVATVALLLASSGDSAPVEEVATPAPTASAAPTPAAATTDDLMRELEQQYAVFRRPARPSDRPNWDTRFVKFMERHTEFDWSRSRRRSVAAASFMGTPSRPERSVATRSCSARCKVATEVRAERGAARSTPPRR